MVSNFIITAQNSCDTWRCCLGPEICLLVPYHCRATEENHLMGITAVIQCVKKKKSSVTFHWANVDGDDLKVEIIKKCLSKYIFSTKCMPMAPLCLRNILTHLAPPNLTGLCSLMNVYQIIFMLILYICISIRHSLQNKGNHLQWPKPAQGIFNLKSAEIKFWKQFKGCSSLRVWV